MDRIERLIQRLEKHRWLKSAQVRGWQMVRADYENPATYHFDGESQFLEQGDWLVNSGKSAFLEANIAIPEDFEAEKVGFIFTMGGRGEALLSIDGKPYHGLDRNHQFVPLPKDVISLGRFHAKIELFNPKALPRDELNDQVPLDESAPPPLYLLQAILVVPNHAVENLLWTVQLYHSAMGQMSDGSDEQTTVMKALLAATDRVLNVGEEGLTDQEHVSEIERSLRSTLNGLTGNWGWDAQGTVRMVGQSHIDVAWLWPLKETIRKASRTFSTACTLLDEYPYFVFSQSQPQLYQYTKQHYPEVYERVKQQVSAGRWEIVGGMWVEPDLNIPSGESLVRQLLLGKRFFEQEFDVNPRVEWLPDTFGYCASLPQLLKKSGTDYFMTTKMNWNDTNPFPYDLFYWVGIDGTKVLSFLNHGLGEHTTPKDVAEHWNSYKQKDLHREQMFLYGHGDGGGGVTREMVEYIERSETLPGLPRVVHSKAHDFFDGVQAANPRLPHWVGDLYLELHRGTYTTHARNKRLNRKVEVLYREAEIWNSFASAFGATYPAESLNSGWKLVLLNQFHDIIPGSSIHEVYETSYQDYDKVFAIGQRALTDAMETIASHVNTEEDAAEGQPMVLFNGLSWNRCDEFTMIGGQELVLTQLTDRDGHVLPVDVYQNLNGEYELATLVADLPPIGYTTVFQSTRHGTEANQSSDVEANSTAVRDTSNQVNRLREFTGVWDTPLYEVEWNEHGNMTRLFDKHAQREIIPQGSIGNELQVFRDEPTFWDAWDVDPRFNDQRDSRPQLQSAKVVHHGRVRDVLRFHWTVGQSSVAQDIVFHHHAKRIDFVTKVDWHESHKLLKVAFPVDVVADKARFEIPFGSVERSTHTNTSWESAQFEVCGHRFADLSEGGYGVSLLNDCKYGYDVKHNVLRLSLLRAPKWPDPQADQGEHDFTYSLFPHEGDWREANVVRQGFELNHPIQQVATTKHRGQLSRRMSFLAVCTEHGVIDTVKQAEDGTELILRLYESGGGREQVQLTFATPVQSAEVTNLLEQVESSLTAEGVELATDLKPFEVQTLKVSVAPMQVGENDE